MGNALPTKDAFLLVLDEINRYAQTSIISLGDKKLSFETSAKAVAYEREKKG